MNWLERYTFAVKAYLPQNMKDDVANELLSDLQDEYEHRAEIQGRDLSEDEIKALLRERGHPMVVAAGFQPRRTLVSESLFPLYLVLLKWLVVGLALVQGAAYLMSVMQQADPNYVRSVMQLVWSIINTGLYTFAWLTLIFYILGESLSGADIFKNWRPESLPKATGQGQRISQTASVLELLGYLFALAWLNQILVGEGSNGHLAVVFSDQWSTLLPWINATIVAVMGLSAVKLLIPYWTRRKVLAEWLLYIPAITLLLIIAGWDAPVSVTLGVGEDARVFAIPEEWIDIGVLGYLVVAVVDVVIKGRKILRL